MDRITDDEALAANIRNAGFWVRHYGVRRHLPSHALKRAQAITALGLAVRHAFSVSDNFEFLLTAVLDAVAPRDDVRF